MNNANIEINSKINANTERIVRKDPKEDDKIVFEQRPNTVRDSGDDNKLKDNKDKGMRTLAMSVYNPNFLEFNGGEAVSKGPDVWVRKWVD